MPDTIPFGEWTPDKPDRRAGSTEAKGVISIAGSYAPFPDFSEYSGSDSDLDSDARGAKGIYEDDGEAVIFLGDDSKLYWLVSRAATNISKAGGYSLAADAGWQFDQFGDYVVATAAGTNPQVYQMGVSSLFADLGGSPPQATCLATVGDFLMMGKDRTISWSAFNDITDWTPSAATQAGSQNFAQEAGVIQAIVGLDYAAIFQERAIRRGVYVGPPLIWDFGQDAVEKRRGAISRDAVAAYGRLIFFASDDGFYVFDGQQSVAIGYGKVDNYFSTNLNYGYRYKVNAAVDTINKLVVFGFPSGSSTSINEQLIYSIKDGRWTRDDVDLQYMFDLPVDPLTVDNFHTYETSDDLDTSNLNDINIDSSVFDDRRRFLAGVNTSNRLGVFTGSPRPATIDTQEFEAAPGQRALVTEIWPITDAPQELVTAGVGYRRALPGGAASFTTATAMNRVGFCPQRLDARFLRARVQIASGNWTRAEGINHTADLTGDR